MSLLILPLIFVIGYFLLVRPQQQQARRQRALVSSLHVGAEVQTAGGIVGRIIDLDDQFVQLQVGPGTTITFIRSAVQQVLNPAEGPDLDQPGPDDPFGDDLPSEGGLGLGESPVVDPGSRSNPVNPPPATPPPPSWSSGPEATPETTAAEATPETAASEPRDPGAGDEDEPA